MNKIIHLCPVPFYKELAELFYIKESLENGLSVEFWDLSGIIYPGTINNYEVSMRTVRKFARLSQLEEALKAEDSAQTLVNAQFFFDFDNRQILRLLNKYRFKVAIFRSGHIPLKKEKLKQKLWRWRRAPWHPVVKRLYAFVFIMYRLLYCLKEHEIAFAAGRKVVETFPPGMSVIKINSRDYDACLLGRANTNRLVPGKYWVFLDQFLPYHPDLQVHGLKAVKPDLYYGALCKFFDIVERQYSVEVIIAVHPKSSYTSVEFGARKMMKSCTNELVKDAGMVIAHDSTAIGLAVCYEKPIVLIYDSEIERISSDPKFPQLEGIYYWAEILGLSVINISRLAGDFRFRIPEVNQGLYREFKNDYLTWPETGGKPSAGLFVDAVRSLKGRPC